MSSYTVTVGAEKFQVRVLARTGSLLTLNVNGSTVEVDVAPELRAAAGAATASDSRASSASIIELKAPIPGIVSDVKVKVGDSVRSGDTLVVIEAMKMENPIKSPRDGTISRVAVEKASEVKAGTVLITFG